jgi:hypothetical protein
VDSFLTASRKVSQGFACCKTAVTKIIRILLTPLRVFAVMHGHARQAWALECSLTTETVNLTWNLADGEKLSLEHQHCFTAKE